MNLWFAPSIEQTVHIFFLFTYRINSVQRLCCTHSRIILITVIYWVFVQNIYHSKTVCLFFFFFLFANSVVLCIHNTCVLTTTLTICIHRPIIKWKNLFAWDGTWTFHHFKSRCARFPFDSEWIVARASTVCYQLRFICSLVLRVRNKIENNQKEYNSHVWYLSIE